MPTYLFVCCVLLSYLSSARVVLLAAIMAQQLPNQWQSQPVQGQLPYQQQGMFMTTQPNAAPGYLPPQQVALVSDLASYSWLAEL